VPIGYTVHYHVKDIAGASYRVEQKGQKRRQSVVAGRQQIILDDVDVDVAK